MVNDFFLGFAGHAHTRNDLEADPTKDVQLRKGNSVEEAQRLTETVLDKLEGDISEAGYHLKDAKLLILYSSYRGETEDKDRSICEGILGAIERRFKGKSGAEQLRLIGHTTAGEIENEDLELKEVSGIGYNGLSLLALVTNLPVGVGRTWGLSSERGAVENGREMVHDAWVDFSQSTESKEQLQKSKTLLVLTKGATIGKGGWEYFLTAGIADFMRSVRETRIANVIGGVSGDGIIGQNMHQFYGKIGKPSELKILDNDAVCALIPNLVEPSVGLDVSPVRRIGESCIFHFDPDAEPKFKYLKRIGDEDPRKVHARIIFENEAQISRERGLPAPNEAELLQQISEIEGIPLNLTLAKYAFAFPFGNYAPANLLRVHGPRFELLQPVRSHDPSIPGYIVVIDHEKVQKGARDVFNMLRENRGFSERDTTFIQSCISRRLAEMIAGCSLNTEHQIFKEALSSTQVFGFLAYGELSFTHLLQEPFVYNFSCWGMTLRSVAAKENKQRLTKTAMLERETYRRSDAREGTGKKESLRTGKVGSRKAISKPEPMGKVSEESLRHVVPWRTDVDKLLCGGVPENFAVALTAHSPGEKEPLVRSYLEAGVENGETTFYLTVNPGDAISLADKFQTDFYLFVCNPNADLIVKNLPNVFKLKGVENLTNISIALTSAIRRLPPEVKGHRRACLDLVSDVLLQHHAVQTRRWLTALIPELKSAGFTILAVIDPLLHSPEELHAILGLFEGEINLYEKETEKGSEKYLRVKRMSDKKYLENELPLKKQHLHKRK
ncbi:MAG TPA: ATPase domain-containing protein [candidate division Zixibacteria bacterium]|nr:ATPase domain-containing protein [candidate division Zixibacteria bacterium]